MYLQLANKLSSSEIYNHSAIRNVTVVFGSVFSNIHVRKYNKDGSINKVNTSLVPISYSAKETYELWLDEKLRRDDGNTEINIKLPRLSFEMTGLSVNTQRGMNTNIPIYGRSISANGRTVKSNTPISYQFDYNLTIWAKNMDDSIQILDQILPMFTPEISIKLRESIRLNIINDVKIVLNSISKNDNFQTVLENRILSWELSFSVFADIMPVNTEEMSIVETVMMDTIEANTEQFYHGKFPDWYRMEDKYEMIVEEQDSSQRKMK